jgi:hypothetical protein
MQGLEARFRANSADWTKNRVKSSVASIDRARQRIEASPPKARRNAWDSVDPPNPIWMGWERLQQRIRGRLEMVEKFRGTGAMMDQASELLVVEAALATIGTGDKRVDDRLGIESAPSSSFGRSIDESTQQAPA